MIQVLLISLLQFWVTFLESAFASKSFGGKGAEDDYYFFHQYQSNNNHHNGSGTNNGTDDPNDRLLPQAYEILELTPPVSLEQARKQWKKLSLRYHPDRNHGSEESHAMQQRVNEAFHRIVEALEGGNSSSKDDENDDDDVYYKSQDEPETPEPHQTPDRPPPPSSRSSSSQDPTSSRRKRKNTKKKAAARQRFERAMWDRHEQLQRELQAELDKEQRRMRTEYRQVAGETKRIQRETSRLVDFEQREAANRFFMDQVQQRRNHRRRLSNPTLFDKPKHYVMESCTNQLVVAMRLGLDELAAGILDQQVADEQEWILHQPSAIRKLQQGNGWISIHDLMAMAISNVLLQRLDDDHHTLLHYAVYWERSAIMSTLCDLAQQYGILDKIFLAENSHGHIAMDYAWIAKDSSILPVLQTRQQLVQQHLEETQLWPALRKAAGRLASVVREKLDLLTTINSALACGVGLWGFRYHWFLAGVGIPILQSPQSVTGFFQDDRAWSSSSSLVDATSCTPFWTFLITIKMVFWLFQFVASLCMGMLRWEIVLLLVPILALCGCFNSRNTGRGLELLQSILFVGSMMTTTLVYTPLDYLERWNRRWMWKRNSKLLRTRPALFQTMTLVVVWVLAGLFRHRHRIASVLSEEKLERFFQTSGHEY